MVKTNWQDPKTSEMRSTHISGLQEAVGKLEESVGINTATETNIPLSEVFISNNDRYRIYQALEGKRNWILSPAPVIKKNGTIITSGFEIDYGGGAVIFNTPILATDILTADATYTTKLTDRLVTESGWVNLSNKTLVEPKILGALNDIQGGKLLNLEGKSDLFDGDAVNEVTIFNGLLGNGVGLKATGEDTNIDLLLSAKGAGKVKLNGKEVATSEDLATHQADLASQELGKGASLIGIHDVGNKFTATNVEGAINELFTNVSNGKSLVGGAITGVDSSIVIPTDPTFQDLATAIGQINTGKKWAIGTIENLSKPNNVSPYARTISNLDFAPKTVIFRFKRGSSPYYRSMSTKEESVGGFGSIVESGIYRIIIPNEGSFRANGFTAHIYGDGNYDFTEISFIAFE